MKINDFGMLFAESQLQSCESETERKIKDFDGEKI